MKLSFSGKETIDVAPQTFWNALIAPEILQKVVPGCREMRAVGEGEYIMVRTDSRGRAIPNAETDE